MEQQAKIIPTRQAVSAAWEAYLKLVQAGQADLTIAHDPAFIVARERAHARWSQAFVAWSGE